MLRFSENNLTLGRSLKFRSSEVLHVNYEML